MSNAQARKRREAQSEQANGGREMTTPSGQKRGRSFVGGLDTGIESENER